MHTQHQAAAHVAVQIVQPETSVRLLAKVPVLCEQKLALGWDLFKGDLQMWYMCG